MEDATSTDAIDAEDVTISPTGSVAHGTGGLNGGAGDVKIDVFGSTTITTAGASANGVICPERRNIVTAQV